jgi:REP element-mobilizing transposase RayT
MTGQVAIRVSDLLWQIVMKHERTILWGKKPSDPIYVLVGRRPHVDVNRIVKWLKGIISRILLQEFAQKKTLCGRHLLARDHFAVSAGSRTGEMVTAYIAEQESDPVHDDSRFVIDNPQNYRLLSSRNLLLKLL